MKATWMLPATILLLAGCAAVRYEAPDFGARASGHRTIAVLPFEMIFTGRPPARLAPDQVARIEEGESLAFQAALYDSLLHYSSANKRRRIRVDIQPIEVTNQILDQNDIELRRTWGMEPTELARFLGVDAVVRTRVQKTRYLSDFASYGIDVGLSVLHESGVAEHLPLPDLARTHDIYAESILVDAADGRLLWKRAVERRADWAHPANDVIVHVTRKLAKRFPYRG